MAGWRILMVVLASSVLLYLGVIINKTLNQPRDPRLLTRSLEGHQLLSRALGQYEAKCGRLPTTEQGLQALVSRPTAPPIPIDWEQILKEIPLDPWDRPYHYESPGSYGLEFELRSFGADGTKSSDDLGYY